MSDSVKSTVIVLTEEHRQLMMDRFMKLVKEHPEQGRPELVKNDTLMDVAKYRVEDMLKHKYTAHTNLEGLGPNKLARNAGYAFPDNYGTEFDANNIESLAGGFTNMQEAFDGLLESPGHKAHILGLSQNFASQTNYGIYYGVSGEPRYVLCFITAPPIVEVEREEPVVDVPVEEPKIFKLFAPIIKKDE